MVYPFLPFPRLPLALKKTSGASWDIHANFNPSIYSYRETGNGWVTQPNPRQSVQLRKLPRPVFFPTFLVLILVDPLFASSVMVPTSRQRWKGRKFGASDFNKIAVLGVRGNFQGCVWFILLTEIILSKNPSIYKVYLAIFLGFRRS